jgi:hypothetical protein
MDLERVAGEEIGRDLEEVSLHDVGWQGYNDLAVDVEGEEGIALPSELEPLHS